VKNKSTRPIIKKKKRLRIQARRILDAIRGEMKWQQIDQNNPWSFDQ
jgi:hypothetical protein